MLLPSNPCSLAQHNTNRMVVILHQEIIPFTCAYQCNTCQDKEWSRANKSYYLISITLPTMCKLFNLKSSTYILCTNMHSHACEGTGRGGLGAILLPQDLLAIYVWGWCPLPTKHTLSLMTAMIADLGAAILSHSSMVWAGGAISCPTCWRIEIHLVCTNLCLKVCITDLFSIQISGFVMMNYGVKWRKE